MFRERPAHHRSGCRRLRPERRRRRSPFARCRGSSRALPAGPDPGSQDGTHVNSTQIRRDLSGFGKFGKRGVGYNVDSLVSEIRKILRTSGQHNIALFGAGHLGQAIATSDVFADHGFRVVSIFDVSPKLAGKKVGGLTVRPLDELEESVSADDVVVGVLAVPADAAQEVADRLVSAGVRVIFNYSEQLLDVPPEVTVHTSSPAVDLLYALYFYLA